MVTIHGGCVRSFPSLRATSLVVVESAGSAGGREWTVTEYPSAASLTIRSNMVLRDPGIKAGLALGSMGHRLFRSIM